MVLRVRTITSTQSSLHSCIVRWCRSKWCPWLIKTYSVYTRWDNISDWRAEAFSNAELCLPDAIGNHITKCSHWSSVKPANLIWGKWWPWLIQLLFFDGLVTLSCSEMEDSVRIALSSLKSQSSIDSNKTSSIPWQVFGLIPTLLI